MNRGVKWVASYDLWEKKKCFNLHKFQRDAVHQCKITLRSFDVVFVFHVADLIRF